jgi:hypothetical protein
MRRSDRFRTLLVALACCGTPCTLAPNIAQAAQRTAAKPGAKVFFTDVQDGATVPSRFTVHFGIANMEIAPAGTAKPFSGHHHLLIDSPLPPLEEPIPSDVNHLHFGRGQTEAEVILSAGEHTLQLLLGDQDHVPHNPPVVSDVIHVKVDAATVEKARSPSPPGASVSFPDLNDGATVPTRATVKFAISGMELAPAGTDKPNTGHHHLIIDAPTPDLDREIPSDANHLHFGRGQMETQVTLTPGPHTMQLVLGDHDHVPHDPPVVSPVIHVTAVDRPATTEAAKGDQKSGRTASPPDGAVYFVYPHSGEAIYPNSTIRFGLKNMGVAPAGIDKPNTGHHHLLIDVETPPLDQPIPSDVNHLHFGNGQTEKKITLKPGKHTLQLVLGDAQHVSFDPPVMSNRIEVTVMSPRKKRQLRGRRR